MYAPYYPGSFGGHMYMPPPPQQMFMQSPQPPFRGVSQSFNAGYVHAPPPQPMYFPQPSFQQLPRSYGQPVPNNYPHAQRPMLMHQSPVKVQQASQAVQAVNPTVNAAMEPQSDTYAPVPAPLQEFQPTTISVAKVPQDVRREGPQMTIQVAKAPAARVVSRSNPEILANILAGKGASISKPKARVAEASEAVRAAPPPPQSPDAPPEPIIAKATPQDPPLTVDENGNPRPNKPSFSPILKPSTVDDAIPPVDENRHVSFQDNNNERVIRGQCGACGKLVYNDEKRMKSEDGTYFHSECYNRLVAANANASSPQSM